MKPALISGSVFATKFSHTMFVWLNLNLVNTSGGEAEPDTTICCASALRGESECYLLPERSHDRQWRHVSMRMNLDTTSCRRAVEEGAEGGCFHGGPLWLQQASVAPTAHAYPTPTHYPPIVPFPAGRWCGRLAHCRAKLANGSRTVPLRDCQGLASGELIPPYLPQGG